MSKETKAAPAETAQQTAPAAEQEQIQEAAKETLTQEGTQEETQEQAQETLQEALKGAAAGLNKVCAILREQGAPVIFPAQILSLFKFGDSDEAGPFQPQAIESREREAFQVQAVRPEQPNRKAEKPKQLSIDPSLHANKVINV